MQIAKSRLVNLFVHLGCPKAEKWSNEVLEHRAAAICELFDLEMEVNSEYRKFFEKLYAAVQAKVEITIVDDDSEPAVDPIQRIDTSLKLPPFETPVEQQERQEKTQKWGRKKVTDVAADPSEEQAEEPAEPRTPQKRERKGQPPNYGQYLSEWGTWIWMPGYEIDQFFLAGGSGTIPEIMAATDRKRVSVQRHLLLLLRFGLVIWGEGDVFRMATREERIEFMDHGIKEKFRPIGTFVVRKPMM